MSAKHLTASRPEPAVGSEPRRRRVASGVLVGAAYVGLALLVMRHFLADPDGRVSAHLPVDHTWFEWLLSHGAYSLRHLENPLFSTRQNTPVGVNMMANTSVLGVTLPLAPVTMLLGPRIAYLVWMTGALAGTAMATYWVLHRHGRYSRPGALLAGAFAGFAPGVVHHANGQPNFVSNFALPFIVLAVVRLGATGRSVRDGIVLGLLVTYQLFINEELLLITAAAGAVIVVACAAHRPGEARLRARSFLTALAVTALTAGMLCAYPIWFQFHGPGTFRGMPTYHTWGEDLLTYLTMPRDTLGGDAEAETTQGLIEQNTWYGWPVVLLAVVAVVLLWRRSLRVRIAAVVAVVFAILSFGPALRIGGTVTDIPAPWAYIPDDLPVLGLLMPSRLTYAVTAAIALIIAAFWDAVASRRIDRRMTAAARALIAAALLPLLPTALPAVDDQRPPRFITSGAWRPYVPPGRTLIPVPLPSSYPGRDSLSWSAEALHEFPVPEGYFLGPDANGAGFAGPTTLSYTTRLVNDTLRTGTVPAVTDQTRAAVWADVTHWRGSVVVLRAAEGNEPLRALLEQVFGSAEQHLDVWVWDLRGRTGV
ncbi:glycosyltransferase 87 family protein [Actinoplanes sp. NPDC049548]|uniref:glycosyltransferase 87 family protein n=1 Tax=Actinoplanes sp. NPDC049548 TaxID=3155152 RepID=UPI003443D8F1